MEIGTPTEGLVKAFLAAQKKIKNPKFDSKNPHFGNEYASLAAVREAIVPVLNEEGIAVIQNLTGASDGVACETILIGHGGILRFGPLFVPSAKKDAQGFGSAATYVRRYSLPAVVGVVGDSDDDAEGAVGRPKSFPAFGGKPEIGRPTPKPSATPAAPPVPSTPPAPAAAAPAPAATPAPAAPAEGATGASDIFVTGVEEKLAKTGKPYWFIHFSGCEHEKAATFDTDIVETAQEAIKEEAPVTVTFSAMKMGPKVATMDIIPF